jgi:hypothetical protein
MTTVTPPHAPAPYLQQGTRQDDRQADRQDPRNQREDIPARVVGVTTTETTVRDRTGRMHHLIHGSPNAVVAAYVGLPGTVSFRVGYTFSLWHFTPDQDACEHRSAYEEPHHRYGRAMHCPTCHATIPVRN